MHRYKPTLLIITVILTAGALRLCHLIYWNLQRGCLSHGTPLYRKDGHVWNAVFGNLSSAVNYSQ